MSYAIIDNKGIVDSGTEEEMSMIWTSEDEMNERDFEGTVMLVNIIETK